MAARRSWRRMVVASEAIPYGFLGHDGAVVDDPRRHGPSRDAEGRRCYCAPRFRVAAHAGEQQKRARETDNRHHGFAG